MHTMKLWDASEKTVVLQILENWPRETRTRSHCLFFNRTRLLQGNSEASVLCRKVNFTKATGQELMHLFGHKVLLSQTPRMYLQLLFNAGRHFSLSDDIARQHFTVPVTSSSPFAQSPERLVVHREKAASRLSFPSFIFCPVDRTKRGFWHHRKTDFVFAVVSFSLIMSPFSYRTKSQKKRFEEELNERMIQAIDGINAQKWVPRDLKLSYTFFKISNPVIWKPSHVFHKFHHKLWYLPWQIHAFRSHCSVHLNCP